MNLLKDECKSNCSDTLFGICDDDDSNPAYLNADLVEKNKWIATVTNTQNADIVFWAIDNCVDCIDAQGNELMRCDGVLYYQDIYHFVELKSRKKGKWMSKGFKQLRATIKLFIESSNNGQVDNKKIIAQLSNSLRPSTNVVNQEQLALFRDEVGVRNVKLNPLIKI